MSKQEVINYAIDFLRRSQSSSINIEMLKGVEFLIPSKEDNIILSLYDTSPLKKENVNVEGMIKRIIGSLQKTLDKYEEDETEYEHEEAMIGEVVEDGEDAYEEIYEVTSVSGKQTIEESSYGSYLEEGLCNDDNFCVEESFIHRVKSFCNENPSGSSHRRPKSADDKIKYQKKV